MAIETALVVDDSRSARYILQRLLERQQIHVEGVESAEAALAYLREVRPDVVFMDDMLPGMDGQEAVERLAANPATARIPIVMYTGRDDMPMTPSQQRGVIGVLGKPFAPQDVDALLAKLGGTVALPPVTARLVRKPTLVPPLPEPVPSTVSEAASLPMSDDLVPRLLEILDQRLKRRMDVLQKTLNERIENSGLGSIQRTQVTQIARATAAEAAQRPARESARRVAAELMRTDINALNLRLDRLRRRFSTLVTAAVIAVIAAGMLGYLVGAMG